MLNINISLTNEDDHHGGGGGGGVFISLFRPPESCQQEAYQAYQSPSPSSAASPLTVMKAPSAGQLAMPMGYGLLAKSPTEFC
jgi:hypothetical protein